MSRTFQYAVPRAPMWPSTFASFRARCLAPSADMAPVRMSVSTEASSIARGAPVRGSKSVSTASSDGRPCFQLSTKSPTTLTPATPSGATTPRSTLKWPLAELSGTRCTRGSSTVCPNPCARSPPSTAARISSSVSARAATSRPLRYVRSIADMRIRRGRQCRGRSSENGKWQRTRRPSSSGSRAGRIGRAARLRHRATRVEAAPARRIHGAGNLPCSTIGCTRRFGSTTGFVESSAAE